MMKTTATQDQAFAAKAATWLKKNKLPKRGYVCFHHGKPFQWQNSLPESNAVVPGVIAFSVEDCTQQVAKGGNPEQGAIRWEAAQ